MTLYRINYHNGYCSPIRYCAARGATMSGDIATAVLTSPSLPAALPPVLIAESFDCSRDYVLAIGYINPHPKKRPPELEYVQVFHTG